MAVFTGTYYLLFRKETFHRFNRVYLVSSLVLSVILPGITLTPFSGESNYVLPEFIGAVAVYANRVTETSPAENNSFPVLTLAYFCMTFVSAGYLVIYFMHLRRLLLHNNILVHDNHKLILLRDGNESFSFFNLIFIHPAIVNTDQYDRVIKHELAHVQQVHSMDRLMIQLLKIFQWFNPFLFLIEKALKETHEYLADAAVLEQDSSPDRYRLLLLTQVFGVQPGIFNFFNHSLIKNRLTMMTKEKSPSRNRFKYLSVLPLLFVMGLLMCCKLNSPQDAVPPPPPPPPAKETVDEGNLPATDEASFVFVDEQATFQGGDINSFREWVQKNLVYPPVAVEKGIFGRVTLQFSVGSTGKVTDIKVLRGVDPLLDKEAIRVIQSSPDWIPAKVGEKAVKQQFVIPVMYMLQ